MKMTLCVVLIHKEHQISLACICEQKTRSWTGYTISLSFSPRFSISLLLYFSSPWGSVHPASRASTLLWADRVQSICTVRKGSACRVGSVYRFLHSINFTRLCSVPEELNRVRTRPEQGMILRAERLQAHQIIFWTRMLIVLKRESTK